MGTTVMTMWQMKVGKDARHENIFHEVPVQQHVDDETIPDVHGSSPHFSDEVSLGQFQT